jgi:hypothetical protein
MNTDKRRRGFTTETPWRSEYWKQKIETAGGREAHHENTKGVGTKRIETE